MAKRGARREWSPDDISIAARASARRLRYRHRPDVETSFSGERARHSQASASRKTLSEEGTDGYYRDVRVDWRIAGALASEAELADVEHRAFAQPERTKDARPR